MTSRKPTRHSKSRCTVCRHPERARIELLRISGISLGVLEQQFRIEKTAIWRHCAHHLTEADKAAYLAEVPLAEMAARAADENVSLLDFYRIVRGTLMNQFQLAHSVNDRRAVAALAGRLNEVLVSIGGITGEMLKLAPGAVTNNNLTVFVNSPAFADLQAMLLRKLQGQPEALAAVIDGLLELENSAVPKGPMIEGAASHVAA